MQYSSAEKGRYVKKPAPTGKTKSDDTASAVLAEWFVYVLLNAAGVAYTGIAKDVAARLEKHNAGTGAKFTRGRGPWRAVHREGPMPKGDALRRELTIKGDTAFKAGLKSSETLPVFHSDADGLPARGGADVLAIALET
ncbi:MAG TPA: GIY-YIG nuclease family protein [Rhodospirillaceae bacterium]|nr:GIY-YIG nuclease family protein [Rhodospirillaceae bacterium]